MSQKAKPTRAHLTGNSQEFVEALKETSEEINDLSRQLHIAKHREKQMLSQVVNPDFQELIDAGFLTVSVNRRKLWR